MGRVFRFAVEQEEVETVEVKGPLASVFADALAVALAKREHSEANGEDPSVAMENQQQEVAVMASLVNHLQNRSEDSTTNPIMYAVSGPEFTEKDYVDITTNMAETQDPKEMVVFVDKVEIGADGTPNLTNDALGETGELISAMESVVHRMGGKVYYSMGSIVGDFNK